MIEIYPNHQVCPTCKGDCHIFVGKDYNTMEYILDECIACSGLGVMLWMMPSEKAARRKLLKWFKEPWDLLLRKKT